MPEHASARTQSNTIGGDAHRVVWQITSTHTKKKKPIRSSAALHWLVFSVIQKVFATGVKHIRGQWSPFYYNACLFFFLDFGDANKDYRASFSTSTSTV